jgi:hypothetical protein
MKELSIEEKAKRYDYALERAKKMLTNEIVEDIFFHELKESEDERIRGAIIDHLKDNNLTEWAAWFEKQGEQKQIVTQKPKPKFKVGDWVVDIRGNVNCVKEVDTLDNTTCGYTLDNDAYFSGSWADDWHLWTIKDAKDGDVLAYENGNICIFDGTIEEGIYPFAHCGITRYGFETCDRRLPFSHDNNVHPATKEQRELLFDKMKKAGYEWDAEKKELKKSEQKPVDIEAIKA